jgi:hypothetical protein
MVQAMGCQEVKPENTEKLKESLSNLETIRASLRKGNLSEHGGLDGALAEIHQMLRLLIEERADALDAKTETLPVVERKPAHRSAKG